MAQSDFTAFPGNLSTAIVSRGVSNGFTPPSGGGSWVYGWNSLQSGSGAVGLYYNDANFAPTVRGVSLRVAMKRQSGTDCTPFLFANLSAADVGNNGYLIGLAQDESPARLIIVKGAPSSGLSIDNAIDQSTAAYQVDEWLHLRLDVIVQPNGDVELQVFENDLGSQAVTAPVWVAVPGLESFVDDALGINSGNAPYLAGYCGFAYYTNAVGKNAFIDHLEAFRQN
jgi:hypothetical protein